MLTLKTSNFSDDHVLRTVYDAMHSRPGRGGTVLHLDVVVEQHLRIGRASGKVVLDPVLDGGSTEEVLNKLADWAERLAIALRHRGVASNRVPVFEDPVQPANEDDESSDTADD